MLTIGWSWAIKLLLEAEVGDVDLCDELKAQLLMKQMVISLVLNKNTFSFLVCFHKSYPDQNINQTILFFWKTCNCFPAASPSHPDWRQQPPYKKLPERWGQLGVSRHTDQGVDRGLVNNASTCWPRNALNFPKCPMGDKERKIHIVPHLEFVSLSVLCFWDRPSAYKRLI